MDFDLNCKKCDFNLNRDLNFCPKCGTKVDIIEVYQFCPNCGIKNDENQFCIGCKKDLSITISSDNNHIKYNNNNQNLDISSDNQLNCYFKNNGKLFGPINEFELELLLKHNYLDLDDPISINNKLNWIEVTTWKKTYLDKHDDLHFVDFDVIDSPIINYKLAELFSKGESNKINRELMNIVYSGLKNGRDYELLISYFIGVNCGFVVTSHSLIIIEDVLFAKTKILDLSKIEEIGINIFKSKYLEIDYKETDTSTLIKYKVYKKHLQYILENLEIVRLLIDISKKSNNKNVSGRLINELNRLEKLENQKIITSIFSEKIRIRALNLESNAIEE